MRSGLVVLCSLGWWWCLFCILIWAVNCFLCPASQALCMTLLVSFNEICFLFKKKKKSAVVISQRLKATCSQIGLFFSLNSVCVNGFWKLKTFKKNKKTSVIVSQEFQFRCSELHKSQLLDSLNIYIHIKHNLGN